MVGGPDQYRVSLSPFGFDFGLLDFRLGLDNKDVYYLYKSSKSFSCLVKFRKKDDLFYAVNIVGKLLIKIPG